MRADGGASGTSSASGGRSFRSDGWYNPVAGFGTDRDKLQSGYFAADALLSWSQLSSMYYGDSLAAIMVDKIVEESFRKGFSLLADDVEKVEDFHKWANATHDVENKIATGLTWGRLFGGALLIIGADDGQDLSAPLIESRIRDVSWILTVDRRYAIPSSFYETLSPQMGRPETYRVTAQSLRSTQTFVVHESRCVRLGAITTDPIYARNLYGWDLPVLQRPYEALRAFVTAMQGAGLMLSDASQGVFKMKDLIAMIGSDPDALAQRMQMVDMGRSTARSLLLDADGESFEKVATQFAGVPDILDRYMNWLSVASGIPVAILFGRSAAGMNATGDLDLDSWHSVVGSYQQKKIDPAVRRVFGLLSYAKGSPTKGRPFVDLDTEWRPLSVPSEKEDAEAYNTRATGDQTYVTMGALDPAEVAIARFGRGRYSAAAPTVDVEKLETELAAKTVFQDPEAAPPGLGEGPKPAKGEAKGEAEEGDDAEEEAPE